jgi:hypothetical protein
MAFCVEKMTNPFLTVSNRYTFDNTEYEFTHKNLIKHFNNVYVVAKINDMVNIRDLLIKEINKESFESTLNNLILYQVDKLIMFDKKHFSDIIIIKSDILKNCNKFNYNLEESILVLPIFDISFLNIQKYIDSIQSNYSSLKNIYNTIIINSHFNKQMTVSDKLYYTVFDMIKNMNESKYWSIRLNCNINMNKKFEKRRFEIPEKLKSELVSSASIKSNKHENYLDKIYESKDNKDIVSHKYFYDRQQSEFEDEDIFKMYNYLPEEHKKLFYQNILSSKKYCHHILKHPNLINKIVQIFVSNQDKGFNSIAEYIGHAWVRLYLDEVLKEGYLKTTDDIVFDINQASNLPYFHMINKDSPYLPLLIKKEHRNKNMYGIKMTYTQLKINNLIEFKINTRLFIASTIDFDLFKDVDFKENKMAISGSIMTACVQKNNPLKELFNDDLEYFREYYMNSDIDIMIKTQNPYEFIDICNKLEKQFTDNTDLYFQYSHIKSSIDKSTYVYVTEEYIQDLFPEKDINYLKSNLNEDFIITKLIEIIKNKHDLYLDSFYCEDINNDIYKDINNFDPKNINILLYENSYEGIKHDIMVRFNIKYHMNSPYWNHDLELFMIKGDDFMNIVSKFHLPCVRAYYDGDNVYMTPSFISAMMTMTNLHYTYFSSNTMPMEIINKYRQRGFGTILNKNEIKMMYEYSLNSDYWRQLYELNNDKPQDISIFTNPIDANEYFFKPLNKDNYKVYKYDYGYQGCKQLNFTIGSDIVKYYYISSIIKNNGNISPL